MPTYLYTCDNCGEYEEVVPYAERENRTCPTCGSPVEYHIPSPMVLRASFPDGKRRFDSLREANTLQKEAYGQKDKKNRKKIEQEIRKLGVRVSRDGT